MARTATKKTAEKKMAPAKKAVAKKRKAAKKPAKLRNISEIRRHFHRNQTPIFFISATNFNLLGMDEWVRNFKFINYLD